MGWIAVRVWLSTKQLVVAAVFALVRVSRGPRCHVTHSWTYAFGHNFHSLLPLSDTNIIICPPVYEQQSKSLCGPPFPPSVSFLFLLWHFLNECCVVLFFVVLCCVVLLFCVVYFINVCVVRAYVQTVAHCCFHLKNILGNKKFGGEGVVTTAQH